MLFKLARSLSIFMREQLPVYSSRINRNDVKEKEPTEFVSSVDIKLHKAISKFLQNIPYIENCPVISEEDFDGVWPPKSENFWLIDPLDGTHNFLAGIPSFGSMIALVQNRALVFSAIFIPAMEKMDGTGFNFAIIGKGAWRYHYSKMRKIKVSQQPDLKKAFALFEGKWKNIVSVNFAQKAMISAERIRSSLSSSVSGTLVASGDNNPNGVDALISCLNKPWDNLPGCLLVEEAGGIVTDFEGNSWSLENCKNLIYSNGILHQQLLTLV